MPSDQQQDQKSALGQQAIPEVETRSEVEDFSSVSLEIKKIYFLKDFKFPDFILKILKNKNFTVDELSEDDAIEKVVNNILECNKLSSDCISKIKSLPSSINDHNKHLKREELSELCNKYKTYENSKINVADYNEALKYVQGSADYINALQNILQYATEDAEFKNMHAEITQFTNNLSFQYIEVEDVLDKLTCYKNQHKSYSSAVQIAEGLLQNELDLNDGRPQPVEQEDDQSSYQFRRNQIKQFPLCDFSSPISEIILDILVDSDFDVDAYEFKNVQEIVASIYKNIDNLKEYLDFIENLYNDNGDDKELQKILLIEFCDIFKREAYVCLDFDGRHDVIEGAGDVLNSLLNAIEIIKNALDDNKDKYSDAQIEEINKCINSFGKESHVMFGVLCKLLYYDDIKDSYILKIENTINDTKDKLGMDKQNLGNYGIYQGEQIALYARGGMEHLREKATNFLEKVKKHNGQFLHKEFIEYAEDCCEMFKESNGYSLTFDKKKQKDAIEYMKYNILFMSLVRHLMSRMLILAMKTENDTVDLNEIICAYEKKLDRIKHNFAIIVINADVNLKAKHQLINDIEYRLSVLCSCFTKTQHQLSQGEEERDLLVNDTMQQIANVLTTHLTKTQHQLSQGEEERDLLVNDTMQQIANALTARVAKTQHQLSQDKEEVANTSLQEEVSDTQLQRDLLVNNTMQQIANALTARVAKTQHQLSQDKEEVANTSLQEEVSDTQLQRDSLINDTEYIIQKITALLDLYYLEAKYLENPNQLSKDELDRLPNLPYRLIQYKIHNYDEQQISQYEVEYLSQLCQDELYKIKDSFVVSQHELEEIDYPYQLIQNKIDALAPKPSLQLENVLSFSGLALENSICVW